MAQHTPEDGFAAPEPSELTALLEGFEVSTLLARGGMGAVYLARQKSLDREVAIKILPRELAEDRRFQASFESEAKAMARLHHPNLIGVFDFGEVDGFLYIVMDFVKGKSLFHSAHGKAIDQKRVAKLIHGICEGMAHAHEAGIIHRDLKPANILLDPSKEPRIGDFGLAHHTESGEGGELHFGTPDYTAPEVMKGGKADKRSDVFSLGVILYELLTGKLPGENYVPPSQSQDVDRRFDQIVRRAMHPSPAMRFADAPEMAKEIGKLKGSLLKNTANLVTGGASPEKLRPAAKASAPSRSTEQSAPAVSAESGYRATSIRNLVIIGVLVVAIVGVLIAYNRKKGNFERKSAAADKQNETPAGPSVSTPQPQPRPTPAPPREKTYSLRDLKNSLARGKREQLPTDSESFGDHHVYYVEESMSWSMACDYAEEHGGYVATLADAAAKTALAALIPKGSAVWLGGGTTGPETWGWVDGIAWTLAETLSPSSGSHLSLDSNGTLRPKARSNKLPFFIQWHQSGENPGSMAARFGRLKDTAGQGEPAFPPGTLASENRRYYVQEASLTWDEALELARESDGDLAVPNRKSEHDFLHQALTRILPRDGAAWLGGRYHEGTWQWSTGEPWSFTAWGRKADDDLDPDDTALCMRAGQRGGWDNVDPDDDVQVVAYVIEWSRDRIDTKPATPRSKPVNLAMLQKASGEVLSGFSKKHAKAIAENGKAMNLDLENWYNNLDRRVRGRYFNDVQAAREKIDPKDGRINEKGRFPPLPQGIGNRCNAYLDNQRKLDQQFEAAIERERDKYLAALDRALQSARSERLLDQVDPIEHAIKDTGQDAEEFLAEMMDDE